MGGSSSQVIGYKYYCGLMVAIGNTIEKLVNINPDNRGWILDNSVADEAVLINKPDLFGGDKQEGGWVGYIDVHTGKPATLEQNHYLAQHDSEIVSAFPNLSYLVYHGLTDDKGFHVVSMSGAMKEVLYWVKRVKIKNDGSEQWYNLKSEIPNRSQIIGNGLIFFEDNGVISPVLNYETKELIGGFETHETASNFPFPELVSSDNVQGSGLENFKQDSKFRIRGAELTRFEYYRVTCIIEYHVRDFAASVPPGLVIFNETHEKIESGNNGNWKAKKITYVCKSSASNMGIDITALGGVERDNSGSQLFDYACNMLIEKMRAESTPIYADSGDINPIHKIREILTDDTAMNKPESDVNDVNFLAAADRIWDEGLGISWAIQEKTCKEAIDELLYHIEAGIRVNRQTGKYEVILFRDDLLNLNTAMQFNESNIKNLSREVANQDDVINVLNVKYYDRESIKESAFSVYDNGSIMSNGNQEIAESVDFPYFMVRKNAELVANWKLKQLSTPTWKGSFSTGKYEARKLNKYDVIKLSWLNAGFVDMPVRVMKISLGDGVDNTVSIDWVEVVPYSSSNFQPINVDPPTNVVLSAQPNFSKVFEMPYFEACQNFGQTQTDAELANNPDLGYLMIASNKPQNNSLNALLYTNAGAGYKQQATINYCPTAVLDQNIGYLDTSFAIRNIASISSASVGSCILVDDEIMVYQAYNPTTKVLTVKRGALDTVPQKHLSGNTFFFYDAYPSFDTTQYVDGETVNAKSLTTTPSSVLNIADASELPLEFNARAIRPYPPANVKINGSYYPVEIDSDLILTWVDRNRLQQTGGDILGWLDGGVAIENGAEYIIEVVDANNNIVSTTNVGSVNSYDVDYSVVETEYIKVRIYSVRDAYQSYQIFEHTMQNLNFLNKPKNLTAEFTGNYSPENLTAEFYNE